MNPPTRSILARDVKPGMKMDLEEDPFPGVRRQPSAEFEYAPVLDVHEETPDCIVITYDFLTVGYYPTDILQVRRY